MSFTLSPLFIIFVNIIILTTVFVCRPHVCAVPQQHPATPRRVQEGVSAEGWRCWQGKKPLATTRNDNWSLTLIIFFWFHRIASSAPSSVSCALSAARTAANVSRISSVRIYFLFFYIFRPLPLSSMETATLSTNSCADVHTLHLHTHLQSSGCCITFYLHPIYISTFVTGIIPFPFPSKLITLITDKHIFHLPQAARARCVAKLPSFKTSSRAPSPPPDSLFPFHP